MSPKGGRKKKPKKKNNNAVECAHTRSMGPTPPEATATTVPAQEGNANNHLNAPIDIMDQSAMHNNAIASDEEAFEETKENVVDEEAVEATTENDAIEGEAVNIAAGEETDLTVEEEDENDKDVPPLAHRDDSSSDSFVPAATESLV